MEKYERIPKPKPKSLDNEIRITKKTPVKNYVQYVLKQFREGKT